MYNHNLHFDIHVYVLIKRSSCSICSNIFNNLQENLNEETIEKQFRIVKKETNTSTVCQFGDLVRLPGCRQVIHVYVQ